MMGKVWNWVTDLISAQGAKKISVAELKNRIGSGCPTLILDVRAPEEQETSCIPTAVLLHPGENPCQRKEFKSFVNEYMNVGGEKQDCNAIIVVYCTSTYSSSRVCCSCNFSELADRVCYLDGGIVQWINDGGSLISPATGEIVKCLRCSTKLIELFVKKGDPDKEIQILPVSEEQDLHCAVPDQAAESTEAYLNR